jgi:LysR family glycine cleavage system transcriptional activator
LPGADLTSVTRLPPLTALRCFVVAAGHLSFVRAAADLHVTPAAVGQQIRQLEAHLGRALFRRVGRQLALTDEGATLLPGLTEAFAGIVQSVSRLGTRNRTAPLLVSVAPSFAAKWLVPRLNTFNALHSDIEVRIAVSMALVDFATDDVDCAIRFGSGAYRGLSVEKLLEESVFPVCSPALLAGPHALDRAEALGHYALLHDDSLVNDAGCPDWRRG